MPEQGKQEETKRTTLMLDQEGEGGARGKKEVHVKPDQGRRRGKRKARRVGKRETEKSKKRKEGEK